MEIALLGSSGIRVSRLALGLGFRNQTDLRVMEAAIARAMERGVTLLDCSNFYGRTPRHTLRRCLRTGAGTRHRRPPRRRGDHVESRNADRTPTQRSGRVTTPHHA